MAKAPAKFVLKALSDSHLRAIGMVAAQWASLELSVLWILSKIVGLSLRDAVILAGAQNAVAWAEMLKKITSPQQVPGKPKVKSPIDPIRKEIGDLLKLRNDIVHSSWDEPERIVGLLDMEVGKRPTAASKARGIGIPKRGNLIFSQTTLTTKEMLAIVKRIQEVELAVFEWWNQRKKTNRLAELLRTHPASSNPVKNLGFGDSQPQASRGLINSLPPQKK